MAQDTACDHDDIHHQLHKQLPEPTHRIILDLLNNIIGTGNLPSIYKLAL